VKITACIIAFNEEKNIAEAIKSISWADEVIVVDAESTDKTREIAESLGAQVLTNKWQGFSRQKQFATDNAENDWIFSLDADERVSEKLKSEILKLKNLSEITLADGFRIPRLTFYMNRPIRHSGWYPDWQLRLFNRRRGKWKDVLIHESVEMQRGAKVGKLKNDILHYSVEDAAHHHRMIGERYASLAAEQMFQSGKKTSVIKIATASFTTFFQTYILKRGFLDGFPGFCIARFAAHHAFLKHLFLWEKQKNSNSFQ
ncbi:MAG: glycosyltransferase family 2 protein, partial [Acidobacteria bacterium]|nr:glycosyltransferase family 2 protein [Acidobacteriota bacterium]MCA1640191.1 glycosyltransferase family 2 protein [Acidobacteriota bacterium]